MIGQRSKSLLFSEITVPLTNSCCSSPMKYIFSRNAVQSSQIVKTGTLTLEQKKHRNTETKCDLGINYKRVRSGPRRICNS